MSLWKIAWRSIQQRALASTLTGVSMGLGVALVVAVLVLRSAISDSFQNNAALGYNLIVGAKGGKLQLVLNTVYYLSSPVENIPYSYYKEFTQGKFKPYVAKAIPCCLGDYYDKYRVVGTTPEMFSLEPGGGRSYQCAQGQIFAPDDYFAAVIGSTVAQDLGLKVGSEFRPTHERPAAPTPTSTIHSRWSACSSRPARPTIGPCSSISRAFTYSTIMPSRLTTSPRRLHMPITTSMSMAITSMRTTITMSMNTPGTITTMPITSMTRPTTSTPIKTPWTPPVTKRMNMTSTPIMTTPTMTTNMPITTTTRTTTTRPPAPRPPRRTIMPMHMPTGTIMRMATTTSTATTTSRCPRISAR